MFVCFSSANLNKSYFDNRQDRYLKINNSPNLCQFFIDTIETVAQHSFQVKPAIDEPMFMGAHHPFEGDNSKYRVDAEQSLSLLFSTYRTKYPRPSSLSDDDVLVVPLIQMGMFNINYDRDFNIYLYSNLPENSSLYLATSYFNMTSEYEREIIDNKRDDTTICLLTASPEANGFYDSRGISRYIPAGYTENEKAFVEKAEKKCSDSEQIQMFEYYRPQWTYHAKGLWMYERDNDYPTLTCIGSPNFGLIKKKKSENVFCSFHIFDLFRSSFDST